MEEGSLVIEFEREDRIALDSKEEVVGLEGVASTASMANLGHSP